MENYIIFSSNFFSEEEVEENLNNENDDISNMVFDDDMEAAATKIQAAFKGHKTRKELEKKDDNKSDETPMNDEILEPGQEENEIPVDEPLAKQVFISYTTDDEDEKEGNEKIGSRQSTAKESERNSGKNNFNF